MILNVRFLSKQNTLAEVLKILHLEKNLMSFKTNFIISIFLSRVLIAVSCPRKCHCEGTLVDCSGVGLSEVPKFIPLNTQSLLV